MCFQRFGDKLVQYSMFMANYLDQTRKKINLFFNRIGLENLLDDLKHIRS